MTEEKEFDIEDIIDPTLPIIDCHHHLGVGHGKRYLLDEFASDIATGHNVIATVYVESRAFLRPAGPERLRFVGETEFANGIAIMSASGKFGPSRICAAIVGHADFREGASIGEVLDAHIAAGGGRFRGIRQAALWDEGEEFRNFAASRPPQGLMADKGFREGFAALSPRGLTYDACLFHTQLPELIDLAKTFPDTTIILNHIGFPMGIDRFRGKRDEVFAEWRRSMRTLSALDNVLVKIGGLGMPFFGFDFHLQKRLPNSVELAKAWSPYVLETIDIFGPSRCMMESNFPPDGQSCSYAGLWNAYKRITAGFSADEKRELFSAVATRTYRPDMATA